MKNNKEEEVIEKTKRLLKVAFPNCRIIKKGKNTLILVRKVDNRKVDDKKLELKIV